MPLFVKGTHSSVSTEFKKGLIPWNKGKKNPYSKEVITKMSESHVGIKMPKFTEEHRRKIGEAKKGNKQWNYKGGVTKEYKKIRNSIDFRLWREGVFERDNYTCQKCKQKGGTLHPHNIKNFYKHIDLRFELDNGLTFCEKCHKKFHNIYDSKNNTPEQILEYLND